ncbi:MAG: hypothetical protein EXR52_05825 [Dehalococcoidia bacterium]|nr:hypothetical protein [Dehalococcoidia bacterium]
MLKVELKALRARVVAHEAVEGALLAETVRGGCTRIETVYEVETDAEPGLVAAVLRNAHNICIVGNTVRNGVEQVNTFVLNGATIAPETYPPLRDLPRP